MRLPTLWLLRLIRTIVNAIQAASYDQGGPTDPAPTAAELNHRAIASRIRDILIEAGINEN